MNNFQPTVRFFTTCLAALSVFFLMPPNRAFAEPPTGYTLFWSDEFDQKVGQKPNPAHWGYDTGININGNQELQEYVSDVEHTHIVADKDTTDGKALQIQATSDGKGHYKSGRLQSVGKVNIQYGYIEARIKLPAGQGIWPAFWMLGKNIFDKGVGWPQCGEIDIMENVGKREWLGMNEGSLHGPGYSGANSIHEYYRLPAGQFFKNGYHTFGLLWEENSVTFSVDGHVYEKRTPADVSGKPWVYNQPFFFIINLAVGGNFPGSPDNTTVFPQKLLVDYVRVYKPAKTTTTKSDLTP